MTWIDSLGFVAAISVVASFCMSHILMLRLFALLSNVLFILYGLLGHIVPVLCLHLILLPVNVTKLCLLQRRKLDEKTFSTDRNRTSQRDSHRVTNA